MPICPSSWSVGSRLTIDFLVNANTKKTEIQKLASEVQKKHLTIVPLKLYFKNNYLKLEIGLSRGKKLHDKREVIKKREFERRSKQNKY